MTENTFHENNKELFIVSFYQGLIAIKESASNAFMAQIQILILWW